MELKPKIDASAPTGQKALGLAALALAFAFAVLLGVRLLNSPDLGYHLAYGDTFWATGKIVDSSPMIYTLPAPNTPTDQRPAPGPGCWYDEQGNYRFTNANWLTQIIFSKVNQLGGVTALCVLQAGLVAAIFLLLAITMRRLKLPWLWIALGLFLAAITAHERFNLRPELFSFLVLVAMMVLLVKGRITWLRAAVLVVLMWLLANLHSYFLLGLVLTGGMLADRFLQWAWARLRSPKPQPSRDDAALASRDPGQNPGRQTLFLTGLLVAQIAVLFANPWTWRLAIMPIQTFLYISANGIAGADFQTPHPWSSIGEFFSPFAPGGFTSLTATVGYVICLIVGAAGILACLIRRRWGWAIIIGLMLFVSYSMRRNIPLAAYVCVPLALAAIWEVACATRRLICRIRQGRQEPDTAPQTQPSASDANLAPSPRCGCPVMRWTVRGLAICVILAMGLFCWSVVTQRFYVLGHSATRFGVGLSRTEMPIDACKWINDNRPVGRIWTDYDTSSNLHYFTTPHRDVPALTNTWAYPPDIMEEGIKAGLGKVPMDNIRTVDRFQKVNIQKGLQPKYSIQVVLLKVTVGNAPLIRTLAKNPNWTIVHVDPRYVMFLRNNGVNFALAEKSLITENSRDLAGVIEQLKSIDPVGSTSLFLGALSMHEVGWEDASIAALREVVRLDNGDPQVWNRLGNFLGTRARHRFGWRNMAGGKADLQEARQCFEKALAIRSDYPEAAANLNLANKEIEDLRKGLLPQDPG